MNIRITPYVFALIDWDHPVDDPLRKQFLPVASQMLPDHPFYLEDSLSEDEDAPVPMLTHRYPDKVLFLPLTTCPVYCSYCTRSRIIGGSTETIEKETYGANMQGWDTVFEYLRGQPQVEDVVISGGDAFNMTARHLSYIGESLLSIPHIRRLRYATKGIAVLPMKILTDEKWVNALLDVHRRGHAMGKQVVIHTHFSSPQEITQWSVDAMDRLFSEHVLVRNQAVLQEGVNNDADVDAAVDEEAIVDEHPVVLRLFARHGTGLRTPADDAWRRGGAGKAGARGDRRLQRADICLRLARRREESGTWRRTSTTIVRMGFRSGGLPNVKPGELFLYFDPLHRLSSDAQQRWADPSIREQMVRSAIPRRRSADGRSAITQDQRAVGH